MLLERINSPFVRSNTSVLQALMRLIPFLAFGEEDKMLALINHFKPYLDFSKYVRFFLFKQTVLEGGVYNLSYSLSQKVCGMNHFHIFWPIAMIACDQHQV